MRRPSTFGQLHAWHTATMRGEAPAIHEGFPECGWFKRKMTKGGCWVPVRIYVERDIDADTGDLAGPEVLRCTVEGIDGGDPADHWTYLTAISRTEFDDLVEAPLRDPEWPMPTRPST